MSLLQNPIFKNLVKRYIPRSYVDCLFLTFPGLYRLCNYESQMTEEQLAVLYDLVDKNISGNIIECGVYRAGTTVLIARHLIEHETVKKIYALDSFSGFLPAKNGVEEEIATGLVPVEARSAFTNNSVEYVQSKITKLGLNDMVDVVPGYFEDTLVGIDDTFSLVLIDCDLKKSIEFCLTTLWDKVVPGGHIVVDDYTNPGYRGAKVAFDQFLQNVSYKEKRLRHGLMVVEK